MSVRRTPDGDLWTVVRMTGTAMDHPWLARDPNCPEQRHPTRDCRCKSFKSPKEAWDYVAEQRTLEATT